MITGAHKLDIGYNGNFRLINFFHRLNMLCKEQSSYQSFLRRIFFGVYLEGALLLKVHDILEFLANCTQERPLNQHAVFVPNKV